MVKQLMDKFCMTKVTQVAWGQNRHVDSLAMLALAMTEDVPQLIKMELITEFSIGTAIDYGVIGVSVTVISTTVLC